MSQSALVGGAASVVRGSPTRTTDLMEMLQAGYLYAVSAGAGCNVHSPTFDEGVDALLSHVVGGNAAQSMYLKVQMKATAAHSSSDGTYAIAKMSRKRYDQFRETNISMHQIVVVMLQPSAQEEWVLASGEHLMVRHCAYWVNLAGEPAARGTGETVQVKAPLANVFDDIALCSMMERIRQGGAP